MVLEISTGDIMKEGEKKKEMVLEISTGDIMKEGEKKKTNQDDKDLRGSSTTAQRNTTQMFIFFLAFDLLFSLVKIFC